jgi:hypothetical protein
VPLVQGALDLLEALQLLDQELEDVLRGTSAASARGGGLGGRRLRGATKRGRERGRESLLEDLRDRPRRAFPARSCAGSRRGSTRGGACGATHVPDAFVRGRAHDGGRASSGLAQDGRHDTHLTVLSLCLSSFLFASASTRSSGKSRGSSGLGRSCSAMSLLSACGGEGPIQINKPLGRSGGAPREPWRTTSISTRRFFGGAVADEDPRSMLAVTSPIAIGNRKGRSALLCKKKSSLLLAGVARDASQDRSRVPHSRGIQTCPHMS